MLKYIRTMYYQWLENLQKTTWQIKSFMLFISKSLGCQEITWKGFWWLIKLTNSAQFCDFGNCVLVEFYGYLIQASFTIFSSALQQNSRVHPVSQAWYDLYSSTLSVKIFLPICVQIFLWFVSKYFCPSVKHQPFSVFSAFNEMRTFC